MIDIPAYWHIIEWSELVGHDFSHFQAYTNLITLNSKPIINLESPNIKEFLREVIAKKLFYFESETLKHEAKSMKILLLVPINSDFPPYLLRSIPKATSRLFLESAAPSYFTRYFHHLLFYYRSAQKHSKKEPILSDMFKCCSVQYMSSIDSLLHDHQPSINAICVLPNPHSYNRPTNAVPEFHLSVIKRPSLFTSVPQCRYRCIYQYLICCLLHKP